MPGVTIADDALTRDSTLIVERARPRDAQGVPLQGRETSPPEHVRLVKSGSRCVLVHDRTGRRWDLATTSCAAPGARRPFPQGARAAMVELEATTCRQAGAMGAGAAALPHGLNASRRPKAP